MKYGVNDMQMKDNIKFNVQKTPISKAVFTLKKQIKYPQSVLGTLFVDCSNE